MRAGGQMSLPELLDQAEVWCARDENRELQIMRVAEMDARHLANLRTWLLRAAPKIHQAAIDSMYQAGMFFSGEAALDSIDGEISRLESQTPEQWIEDQILFEAITDRLATLLEETHGA